MSRLLSTVILALFAPVVHAGAILGNVDSVSPLPDGTFQVKGWACYTGFSQSISVHVYAGGAAGVGTAIGSGVANQTSESGVSNACGTTGVPHRYAVTMGSDKREVHANKLLYVHGIVPAGQPGTNLTISGSGTLRVPPLLVVTRRYVYGEDLRLCKVIEPETGANITQYDDAGNVLWTASGLDLLDPTKCNRGDASYLSGRRVDRTYDARNRIESLAFPDGRGDLNYTYGSDGKAAAIVAHNDGVGQNVVTTTYEYFRRGPLKSEEMKFGAAIAWPIDYAYSRNGHLAQQTYHGLTVDYAPNALGQATKAGTFASDVTYHPGGAIKQFTYGNGIVHTMTQNMRGLPDRSLDSYPGLPDALDDSYTYDGNGNVAAISDGATADQRGNRTMIYDGLDRLRRAQSIMFGTTTNSATAYTYDGADNILRLTINSTPQVPGRDHYYCYDSSQRLTNVRTEDCDSLGSTVIGLSYDPQGNLSNRNGQNFDFDFGNRLRKVYPNSGQATATYLYDGRGRRIRDYTSASKYSQYSAEGQLLQASDGRAGVFSEYVYLGGSLVAIRERTGPSGSYVYTNKYQHTDALGSPVAVTNSSRAVIERMEYEPYGKVLVPTTPKDGPGYTGHVLDSNTGLNYMQQRYYDPAIGRFLSVDPVTAYGGDNRYFNRYWYAAGNPYKYNDPDGRILDVVADVGFIAYSAYKLVKEPSWTNAAALGADVVGAVVPFATGLGAGVRATSHGVDAVRSADNVADGAKADFVVSSNGTVMHSSPDQVRASLDGAGFKGEAVANKAGTETGTRHNIPDMKMDVRVMDGGPNHAPRVVTNQQGTSSMVDSATGKPFKNDVPKPERIERSHIKF